MGRLEVLKVVGSHLANRRGVIDRFVAEIRNAARLHHPNIVTAYSATRLGESLVLAMEYIEGLDLSRMVEARGPLPVGNACNYIHQAALGLQHAHEQRMVHRDIKPSNLMLARSGNRAIIKALDFGLVKVQSEGGVDGGLTHEGQMLGTPDYISPEQIGNAKGADIRADIYSLGCTLYYLLTAGPPFEGSSLYDILQAHHSMDAKPLNLARPEVPVELAALVAKMMAKEPERRFQAPKEAAQALAPFFKKGESAFKSPVAEVSQSNQAGSRRPVASARPTPTPPAKDNVEPEARSKTMVEGALPKTEWQSLIDVPEGGRSIKSASAASAEHRPPWKKWQIAVAAPLFGLVALGGIIITIRDKEGREISKTIVPDGYSVAVEASRKSIETESSDARQGEARDDSPRIAAGVASNPPVGRFRARRPRAPL